MRVELIGHLKAEAGSESLEITLEGEERLVAALLKLPEKVRRHVVDEKTGKLTPGLLLLVNGAEVKAYEAERIKVGNDDVVTLIPAIHGGGGT